jgi:prolyl oligopeptidase
LQTFIKKFDGIVAITNLRGGGEYGSSWNQAGKLHTKQNVFSDYHACASHLIDHGFTTRDKMVWNGGSNGGLLVMASYLQRPDLVGCVLGEVGVYDVIRFWRFTIGYAWVRHQGVLKLN